MQRASLAAQVREGVGKGTARSLRRGGQIPGILYGRGRDPRPVAVDAKAFSAVIHTDAGMNVLIDLDLPGNGGSAPSVVMVKEVQRDIYRHHPIHVDFHAISLTERMEFHVPVLLKGIAKGIAEGGVVEHHLRHVAVECLPTEIPEHFELDVTELMVGRALHASDLTISAGVVLKTPLEQVVVAVVAPRVIEEAAPAAVVPAEGVPAAEGAPAAAEGAPAAAEGAQAPAEAAAPAGREGGRDREGGREKRKPAKGE
jgi:large subunit ribosomal protein L25